MAGENPGGRGQGIGPRARISAAAVLALALGSIGGSVERPRPWDEPGRAAWIKAAAERAFLWGEDQLDLRKVPELFATPLPRSFFIRREELPRDVSRELHVVANYAQSNPIVSEDGRVTIVPVDVAVGATKEPVVLVLTSFESVVWNVARAPEARVDAVYYSCLKRCMVRAQGGVPAAQELPKAANAMDRASAYDYASYDRDGEAALKVISESLGIPVMSAQGPNESGRFEVPLELDRAVLLDTIRAYSEVGSRHTVSAPGPFVLVENGTIVRKGVGGPMTPVIPKRRIRAVTAVGTNGEYFGLGLGELVRIDSGTGDAEALEPPPDLPKVGWSGGIAYDERSGYVIVTRPSSSGVHHLYAPSTKTWQVVPVARTGGGLIAIAYSPALTALYGLRSGRETDSLVTLDAELNVVGTTELPKDMFRPSPVTSVQMAATGASLVVCREAESDGATHGVSGCVLVDPPSGEVRLLKTGDGQ